MTSLVDLTVSGSQDERVFAHSPVSRVIAGLFGFCFSNTVPRKFPISQPETLQGTSQRNASEGGLLSSVVGRSVQILRV